MLVVNLNAASVSLPEISLVKGALLSLKLRLIRLHRVEELFTQWKQLRIVTSFILHQVAKLFFDLVLGEFVAFCSLSFNDRLRDLLDHVLGVNLGQHHPDIHNPADLLRLERE